MRREVREIALYSPRGTGALRARRVLRFGQRLTGADIPSVPASYRAGPGSPTGELVGLRLRASTGEAWVRLAAGMIPWQKRVRTIPLTPDQPPAPTPDTVELRGGMRVRCHDGYLGRLIGLTLDAEGSTVIELLLHVRDNVLADVAGPMAPMAALLNVAGQQVLVSPQWAISATPAGDEGPATLLLDASAEQIASAAQLRGDGPVAADIWRIWEENPAIGPLAARLSVSVHDGEVVIAGTVPTARHRATAEQDVWHVPGVFAVKNRIVVA